MSRRPLPTETKRLQGTLENSRINPNEPQVTITIPVPADWLPDEVKEIFRDFALQFAQMRVLSEADGKALELLAEAYYEYQQARQFIHANGSTYKSDTANGTIVRAYPQVAIAADAYKRVRAMLIEFGATPAARSRVNALPEGKPKNKLQLIKEKAGKG